MEAISLASEALPKVRLHATAVFSILNHFVRRTDRNARVIGKYFHLAEHLRCIKAQIDANFFVILPLSLPKLSSLS